MKKLVLAIAIIGFITFGALSVQNLVASSTKVELANFDKDPKKSDNKQAADTKQVKAETKSDEGCSKSCGSSCGDKAAASTSCCSDDKTSASTAKETDPDSK